MKHAFLLCCSSNEVADCEFLVCCREVAGVILLGIVFIGRLLAVDLQSLWKRNYRLLGY